MQAILETWPAAALTALVVWVPMLGGDSAATAAEAARVVPDPRARHFYDEDRGTGRSFAARLGG